jgi:hypothetical protein
MFIFISNARDTLEKFALLSLLFNRVYAVLSPRRTNTESSNMQCYQVKEPPREPSG